MIYSLSEFRQSKEVINQKSAGNSSGIKRIEGADERLGEMGIAKQCQNFHI